MNGNDEHDMNPMQALRAVDHLPADLMLVKMEGEHIMTMAAARKVNLPALIEDAKSLLKANPQAAQAAVYSKPVGMKPDVCKKCGHRQNRKAWQTFNPHCPKCAGRQPNNLMVAGKMQYARGLSIKAATSLANLMNYNRVGTSAAPAGDGIYRVTSIFVDYGRGIIRSKERMVSQWRRAYGTNKLEKQDDERFLEMTLAGAASKNERNAILAGIPYELTQAYEQTAMEVAPKFLDAAKVQEIIDAFTEREFTLGDLQVLVGREKSEGWRKEEHETMRGVWVALENGEMTVEELMKELRADGREPVSEGNGSDQEPPGNAEPATKSRSRRQSTQQAPSGDQTTAVANELTGGSAEPPQQQRQPTQTPGPGTPKAAWEGMQEQAEAAENEGDFAKAARYYRDAAGNHPSNDRDNKVVDALLKLAVAAENRPAENRPLDEQPTTRKRSTKAETAAKEAAPAAEPQPTKQAPEPPPPSQGGPPRPAAPTAGFGRSSWTPAKCKEHLQKQWPDEMLNFDVDRLCAVAANQGAPEIYLNNMMNRTNPYWSNFVAAQDQGPVGGEDLPPDEEPAAEPTIDELDRTDPVQRPANLSDDATQFEKMLKGYKTARSIDRLIEEDVEPSTSLTNDEVAWLNFYGRQRKRELDAAGNKGQLPLQG